ncbi:hypothetical protein LSH36_115g13029 [Paralvinella palmiformis]|uniref:Uncharacterized protein n=1 Tax=Paralvinella palmiformis TaxID=53620 RepID=A0AAD9NAK7_9ANNE|nr:hypothetical protein LSH36_115g13029 [Paralvinella palmiformis]
MDSHTELPHRRDTSTSGLGDRSDEQLWIDSEICDSIEELILNEAIALSKMIKSQASGDTSEGTSDGEVMTAECSATDVAVNSHPGSIDHDDIDYSQSDEMFVGAQSLDISKRVPENSEDSIVAALKAGECRSVNNSPMIPSMMTIPVTSSLPTDIIHSGISTTTECFMIMTQLVPLTSSGFYVVDHGNAVRVIHGGGDPTLATGEQFFQQDEACAEPRSNMTDGHFGQGFIIGDRAPADSSLDDSCLYRSLPSSPPKHDITMDEEFFSCEESFTVQDMTLKDADLMASVEYEPDENDERTLSLASSDSDEVNGEDIKSTSTPIIDLSSATSDDGCQQATDCVSVSGLLEMNLVRAENEMFQFQKHPQPESHSGQSNVDSILDRAEAMGSSNIAISKFVSDIVVRDSVDVPKKDAGSVCESLATDDQDSVTDAGYQASESSGQEDTGYEEGETDGMNAMMCDDPFIRRQFLQAVAEPIKKAANVYRSISGSTKPGDTHSPNGSDSVVSGVQELDLINLVESDEKIGLKGTEMSDSTENMELVCTESVVLFKPRISGSEFSETLSYVSASKETAGKTLALYSGENHLDKDHAVSLYVELAEAEHEPCTVKNCSTPTGQEEFSDIVESDIDDAEALLAKSKLLAVQVDPDLNEDLLRSYESDGQKQVDRNYFCSSDPVVTSTSELTHATSSNKIHNAPNQESATGVSPEAEPDHQLEADGNSSHHYHNSGRHADDVVSDVTSEQSNPPSGSQISSNPNDELLQLLDKITISGHGMRRQLEMAYARQAFIHEVGSRVDDIRSNEISDLQQELDQLRTENQKLVDKVASYKCNNKQNGQKVQHLEGLLAQLQTHTECLESDITQQKAKEQEKTANLKDMAVATNALSVTCAATQTGYRSQSESETEFGKGLDKELDLQFEMRTSTPSQLYWSTVSPHSETQSPTIIQGSVELESDDPPKRSPSMVSLMIDKILHQMNNLADVSLNNSLNNSLCNHDNSLSTPVGQADEDTDQEGPEKWRHLAVAPISMDPNILILQRSLAAASFENELLRANVK